MDHANRRPITPDYLDLFSSLDLHTLLAASCDISLYEENQCFRDTEFNQHEH